MSFEPWMHTCTYLTTLLHSKFNMLYTFYFVSRLHMAAAVWSKWTKFLDLEWKNSWTPLKLGTHLTRQDASKCRECIIQSLVVDLLIQVFDEDVSYTRLPQGRITLRPHDSDRTPLDSVKIHGVQSSLSYKKKLMIWILFLQCIIIYSTTSYDILVVHVYKAWVGTL